MKGVAEMQINLRIATTLLRDDLHNDHFEGRRRLSEVNLVNGLPVIVAPTPQAGHFAIVQRSGPPSAANTAYVNEGTDANGMPSFRATDHVLYMTVKRKGNRQESFFTASLTGQGRILNTNVAPFAVPNGFFGQSTAYDIPFNNMPDTTLTLPHANVNLNANTTSFYSSQWAEVVYYLKLQGSTEEPTFAGSKIGTPIFGLYRAQFVMVPDGTKLRTPTPGAPAANTNQFVNQANPANINIWNATTFAQLSTAVVNTGTPVNPQWQLQFLSPSEAAQGNRIIPSLAFFNPQVAAPNAITQRVMLNEALVIPNVVSFHVQPMFTGSNAFSDIPLTNIPPIGASQAATQQAYVFDTAWFNVGVNGVVPGYTNIGGMKAVQITIRVWDSKTRQTRQVTMVQDM
jgi:hypothetical protein